MRRDERIRLAVAYHEAAHAVASLINDQLIASITIVPEGDALGLAVGEDPLGAEFTVDDVRVLIVGLLAGEAAALRSGHMDASEARAGARGDYDMAHRFASFVEATPARQRAFVSKLRRRAATLVRKEWVAIEALARELHSRGTIDGQEVEFILRAARGGADDKRVLAMWRAALSSAVPPTTTPTAAGRPDSTTHARRARPRTTKQPRARTAMGSATGKRTR